MKLARTIALPLSALLLVCGCAMSPIVDNAGNALQDNGDLPSDDTSDDADATNDDTTDDLTHDTTAVATKSGAKDASVDAAAPTKLDAAARDAGSAVGPDTGVPTTIVDAAISGGDAATRPAVADAARPVVVDSGTAPVTRADAAVAKPTGVGSTCHSASDCNQACIGFAVPCCSLRATCGCSLGLLCL